MLHPQPCSADLPIYGNITHKNTLAPQYHSCRGSLPQNISLPPMIQKVQREFCISFENPHYRTIKGCAFVVCSVVVPPFYLNERNSIICSPFSTCLFRFWFSRPFLSDHQQLFRNISAIFAFRGAQIVFTACHLLMRSITIA